MGSCESIERNCNRFNCVLGSSYLISRATSRLTERHSRFLPTSNDDNKFKSRFVKYRQKQIVLSSRAAFSWQSRRQSVLLKQGWLARALQLMRQPSYHPSYQIYHSFSFHRNYFFLGSLFKEATKLERLKHHYIC